MARRAQVSPLPGPEPLKVSNFIPDNFVPARRDNDAAMKLGILRNAVGVFGAAAGAFEAMTKEDPEAKQQRQLEEAAAYARWRSSVTTQEFMDATKRGDVPWTDNPRISEMMQREYGGNLMQQVTEGLIADIEEGRLDLTQPNVNIEQILIDKSAPHLAALQTSPYATLQYRRSMEEARRVLTKLHRQKRGEAVTEWTNNKVLSLFRDHYKKAARGEFTGTQASDSARAIYKAAGPIDLGGSLGYAYPDIDNLHLRALEEAAGDGETAHLVIGALKATRPTVDGSGTELPSFLDTAKHTAKAQQIMLRAMKTVDAKDMAEQQEKIINEAAQMAINSVIDGSEWRSISDVELKGRYAQSTGMTEKLTAEKIREQALMIALAQRAKANGGSLPLDEAIELHAATGVKKTEWKQEFETYYSQFAAAMQDSKGPERADVQQRLNAALARFMEFDGRNSAYMKSLLNEDTYKFFKTAALAQEIGMPPEEVFFALRRQQQMGTRTRISAVDQTSLMEAIGTNDPTKGWFPGTGIKNTAQVALAVTEEVALLMSIGVPQEAAQNAVLKSYMARVVVVNGHAMEHGGFLRSTDGAHFEGYLEDIWKTHGKEIQASFGGTGTYSANDLTLVPSGTDGWVVYNIHTGMPIHVQKGGYGTTLKITRKMIEDARRMARQDQKDARDRGLARSKMTWSQRLQDFEQNEQKPFNERQKKNQEGLFAPATPEEIR